MQLQKSELTFTPEQLNLIKTQIAKDATNDELRLFLYQCQRTGLDPLTRQIYCVKRAGRMTIQTSIDGFRVIAQRSGEYAGQDEPVFTYTESGEILKCAVTVYKFGPNGQRYPAAVGVAFYREYYPNPVMLQKSLAHTMISKTAESLALRKAFPQDLSGIYTAEEMNQAQPMAPTEEMKEELIASLIDLEMEDDKRQLAFDSITNCNDINQFQKIKARLSTFKKSEVKVDTQWKDEYANDMYNEQKSQLPPVLGKPSPEVKKQLTKLDNLVTTESVEAEIKKLTKKMKP
jgi:phage recombination protein Bet